MSETEVCRLTGGVLHVLFGERAGGGNIFFLS